MGELALGATGSAGYRPARYARRHGSPGRTAAVGALAIPAGPGFVAIFPRSSLLADRSGGGLDPYFESWRDHAFLPQRPIPSRFSILCGQLRFDGREFLFLPSVPVGCERSWAGSRT